MAIGQVVTGGLGVAGGLVTTIPLLLLRGLAPVVMPDPIMGWQSERGAVVWMASRESSVVWQGDRQHVVFQSIRGETMASDAVRKQPAEVITFYFDFSGILETGETITGTPTVTKGVTTTPDLTIGSPTIISGSVSVTQPDGTTLTLAANEAVQVQLSAGADLENYKLECICGTSDSNTREVDGTLQVRD